MSARAAPTAAASTVAAAVAANGTGHRRRSGTSCRTSRIAIAPASSTATYTAPTAPYRRVMTPVDTTAAVANTVGTITSSTTRARSAGSWYRSHGQ